MSLNKGILAKNVTGAKGTRLNTRRLAGAVAVSLRLIAKYAVKWREAQPRDRLFKGLAVEASLTARERQSRKG